MAVTQYIGARYVPIFADPIEWSNNRQYEPLTIVLHEGISYTSRQFVPIGINIQNTNYWAETGNFNAQVEQYRNDVLRIEREWPAYKTQLNGELEEWKRDTTDDFTEAIDNIPGILPSSAFTETKTVKSEIDSAKKIAVYIGNSYTAGAGAASGYGMFATTKHLFSEAYSFITGGAGFGSYTNHEDKRFHYLLQDAIASDLFDNDDVTDVIFISAMGDTRAIAEGNEGSVLTGITTCVDLIKQSFPRATMHVCMAEMVYGRTAQASYSEFYYMAQLRTHYVFRRFSKLHGFNYMGWVGWNGNNVEGMNYSDNIHPNEAGYTLLRSKFLNAWFGGEIYDTKSFTINENGIIVYFSSTAPNNCRSMIRSIPKAMFPASIATSSTHDIHCGLVTPTFLPPFVPYVGRYPSYSGFARFTVDYTTIITAFVNTTLNTSESREDDMYLRVEIVDEGTNPQTGNARFTGEHVTYFHAKGNLTEFEVE